MKTLLIIGHTFPEPTTTAAGTRMMQLIELFQNEHYNVIFGSTANISERSVDLKSLGISVEMLALNNPSFDQFLKDINPSVVLFDRFVTEEQFGWRVAETCPKALRILDTEDLHFLRKARHDAFKKTGNAGKADLFTDATKRELASILRCDLSLIISEFEMTLLVDMFKISEELLYYLPFLVAEIPELETLPPFNERRNFITIGNLLHAPNVDSVLHLKNAIWPKVKKAIPEANMHVYGNYASQQIRDLHNEQEGFYIEGWAPSVKEVMQGAKVCLAPLRFGAGLKGKLLDAMLNGLPAITTSMGAEGLYGEHKHNMCVCDTEDEIINQAIRLYTNEDQWKVIQETGVSVLKKRYVASIFAKDFTKRFLRLTKNLVQHRQQHFLGEILQYQGFQATKYLSKWIEEKNKV